MKYNGFCIGYSLFMKVSMKYPLLVYKLFNLIIPKRGKHAISFMGYIIFSHDHFEDFSYSRRNEFLKKCQFYDSSNNIFSVSFF